MRFYRNVFLVVFGRRFIFIWLGRISDIEYVGEVLRFF